MPDIHSELESRVRIRDWIAAASMDDVDEHDLLPSPFVRFRSDDSRFALACRNVLRQRLRKDLRNDPPDCRNVGFAGPRPSGGRMTVDRAIEIHCSVIHDQ